MAEPELVRDCMKAMIDAVSIPVTVKHRIGIDAIERYDFVRDFVGIVAESGCTVFIVHARNAILKGLSPKENREVPPLKYEFVAQLKKDFPQFTFVMNGGLATVEASEAALNVCDGVMLGRSAYHDSETLMQTHAALFDSPAAQKSEIVEKMIVYCERQIATGVQLKNITRHLLGFYQGMNGAKAWRRTLSDPKLLIDNNPQLLREAMPRGTPFGTAAEVTEMPDWAMAGSNDE